jgi:hypothetical protein
MTLCQKCCKRALREIQKIHEESLGAKDYPHESWNQQAGIRRLFKPEVKKE